MKPMWNRSLKYWQVFFLLASEEWQVAGGKQLFAYLLMLNRSAFKSEKSTLKTQSCM